MNGGGARAVSRDPGPRAVGVSCPAAAKQRVGTNSDTEVSIASPRRARPVSLLSGPMPSAAAMAGLPLLDEGVRPPAHRFAPVGKAQFLSSVYTLWNLLDGIMWAERNSDYKGAAPYGYMRSVQLEAYSKLIWGHARTARTYCEVGLNGGHGTAAVLLANERLVAHSFDPVSYTHLTLPTILLV